MRSMSYQLVVLIAIVVNGGAMAISAKGKRAELERRLTLTERKLAQVMQKLAANGVEGMADLWQQPLPPAPKSPAYQPPVSHRPPPNQFGPPANDPIVQAEREIGLDEVRSLFQQGKKIQAIKAYRELTGVGLKEAKDAVEGMAGQF